MTGSCGVLLDVDAQTPGKKAKLNSGVFFSQGRWRAEHNGQTSSFSVSKYGPRAKELAEQELTRLLLGQDRDPNCRFMDRNPIPLALAAEMLSMSIGQLRTWLLTGQVDGLSITPPVRVSGKDAITGVEVESAISRLAHARNSAVTVDV